MDNFFNRIIEFKLLIKQNNNIEYRYVIEQKGITFDHDFGYSFSLFFPPKKGGKKKRTINSKNRDQKSCLSARSLLKQNNINIEYRYMIEHKEMTFYHDFGYSFPLFFPPKKNGKKKRIMNSKKRDQKSCLSSRSGTF